MNKSSPGTFIRRGIYGFGSAPYNFCGGSTLIYDPRTWTNSVTGADNPRWKQIILAGGNATNILSGSKRVIKGSMSDEVISKASHDNGGPCFDWFVATGSLIPPVFFGAPSVDETSAVANARRQVISRAKSILTPVQAGVVMGELTKTVQMIKHPAATLRKSFDNYFSALKKVPRKKSSAYRRKALNDTYLEYTYGWRPLMADAQNGLDTMRSYLAKRPFELQEVRGKGFSESTSFGSEAGNSYSGCQVWYRPANYRKLEVKTVAGIRIQSRATLDSLPRSLGLYPESFVPTAYELMPYSFFIDYFSNVGAIIDGACLVNGNMTWSCETKRTVARTTAMLTRVIGSNPYVVQSASVSNTVWEESSVDRQALTSIVPPLDFRLPAFGSKTALNIAALAYQGSVPRPFY